MDQIANMLTHIRNSGVVGKPSVQIPYSKMKYEIAKLLSKKGYVGSVDTTGKKIRKIISIELLYTKEGMPKIQGTQRVSKSSGRVYRGASSLFPVKYGYGTAVITTTKGILTDKEARKEKIGGEVLFNIW